MSEARIWDAAGRMLIGRDLGMLIDTARVTVETGWIHENKIYRRVRVGFVKAGRLRLLLVQEGVITPIPDAQGRYQSLVQPGDLDAVLQMVKEAAAREDGSDE